jgi:hypothetical protein
LLKGRSTCATPLRNPVAQNLKLSACHRASK